MARILPLPCAAPLLLLPLLTCGLWRRNGRHSSFWKWILLVSNYYLRRDHLLTAVSGREEEEGVGGKE